MADQSLTHKTCPYCKGHLTDILSGGAISYWYCGPCRMVFIEESDGTMICNQVATALLTPCFQLEIGGGDD